SPVRPGYPALPDLARYASDERNQPTCRRSRRHSLGALRRLAAIAGGAARIVPSWLTALNQCPGASARLKSTTAELPDPSSRSRVAMSAMVAGSPGRLAHSAITA